MSPPLCPHHGADACCPECPDHAATDGRGFPHACEARGRKLLQRCARCRRLVGRDRWVHDIARSVFACKACARRAVNSVGKGAAR